MNDTATVALEKFEKQARAGENGARMAMLAAKAVYHAVPDHDRGLKDILVDVVRKHVHAIIHEDDANRAILKDVMELAYDLVIARCSCAPRAEPNRGNPAQRQGFGLVYRPSGMLKVRISPGCLFC